MTTTKPEYDATSSCSRSSKLHRQCNDPSALTTASTCTSVICCETHVSLTERIRLKQHRGNTKTTAKTLSRIRPFAASSQPAHRHKPLHVLHSSHSHTDAVCHVILHAYDWCHTWRVTKPELGDSPQCRIMQQSEIATQRSEQQQKQRHLCDHL
jgi:hypothetical protein